MNFITMLRERRDALNEERNSQVATMQRLADDAERAGRPSLGPDQTRRFDEARTRVGAIDVELGEVEERLAELEAIEERRNAALDAAKPDAPRPSRFASGRPGTERARIVLDDLHRSRMIPDHAAERVERLLDSDDLATSSAAARHVERAGDPHYLGAFAKLVADPTRGPMLWTGEERQAYQAVQDLRAEMRAMSTGAGAGGEMVPLALDPAILLTNDGATNPLRRIARVEQIVTNRWQGVSSAGVTAGWRAEGSEEGDDSPTLDDPTVEVHTGSAFVPFSIEVRQDAIRFVEELSRLLVDAADVLQAEAFVSGTGNDQPEGFVTGLAGTDSELDPATAETFAAEDVYAVQSALGPRFQANARWAASLSTINTIAQFETGNGARMFPELGEGRLLRRPLEELSEMDGVDGIDTGATADHRILAYGDFRHVLIVDRLGSTIELVPHLFGANRRPTGESGLLLWFRTGSKVLVPEAFRVLNVATTA